MDRDAKERIADNINPKRGIRSEVTRELRDAYENPQYRPSSDQIDAMRDYYAETTSTQGESVKLKAKGYDYIKTGQNKFQRVDKREDVLYNPQNNTLYLLDDDGNFTGQTRSL